MVHTTIFVMFRKMPWYSNNEKSSRTKLIEMLRFSGRDDDDASQK